MAMPSQLIWLKQSKLTSPYRSQDPNAARVAPNLQIHTSELAVPLFSNKPLKGF